MVMSDREGYVYEMFKTSEDQRGRTRRGQWHQALYGVPGVSRPAVRGKDANPIAG